MSASVEFVRKCLPADLIPAVNDLRTTSAYFYSVKLFRSGHDVDSDAQGNYRV